MNEETSFARYYRPSSMDEYIGNTKVKESLRNSLVLGKKRPQTMLLVGNTGCGKTTLARIIASWYMCENPNEDGSPCGHCIMCENMEEYIKSGRTDLLPDIKEIDSSEKSGKNDMISVLEEMSYPAYGGGWKVYIIDECHALTQGSATAMLKPLEEPPENVLIILATTNPEKMLDTIRNRCQLQYKITKPNTTELSGLLKKVCIDNGKDYDLQGLRMICSRADYVIRNALNYLEQVIHSRGSAIGDVVAEEFQEVSDRLIFDFYKAYIEKDYMGYINLMYKIRTTYDFGLFLQSLTNFTVRGIYIINNVRVEGMSEVEIKSYTEVFTRFSLEELSYILASLKKMSLGDVESNLMAFIYTVPTSESKETKIDIPVETVDTEVKFRNDNLLALENAKLSKGKDSVQASLKEAPFDEVMSIFNLEKVDS